MAEDQPAVPCNSVFSRAQKTWVKRLLPKRSLHTAPLLLLWTSEVFIKALTWGQRRDEGCLSYLFQEEAVCRMEADAVTIASLCLFAAASAQTVLRGNTCFLCLAVLSGTCGEQGHWLNLMSPEWFWLNGQLSAALRESKFHGCSHVQGLLRKLKGPLFSMHSVVQVQKYRIWDNYSNRHNNSICLSSFHLAPTTAKPCSIAGVSWSCQYVNK